MPRKSFPAGFEQYSRLQYYSTLFNSLEINSSFYKVPQAKTFMRWSGEVPDHFRFSVKCWKQVTHGRKLQYNPADVDYFLSCASGMADEKKGCLLLQFPKSIDPTYHDKLVGLLKLIRQYPASVPWRVSVEFRHPGWYTADVYAKMEQVQAAVVVHDMPDSAIVQPPVNLPWVYCRFHGVKGDYRGDYSSTELARYATRIQKWRSEGREVYAYFNNTLGNAYENTHMLHTLIKKSRRSAGSQRAN